MSSSRLFWGSLKSIFRSPRTRGGRLPKQPEDLPPTLCRWGDVHVHAIELLVASNKLECEEDQRNNSCQFHLVSRVILFPQQGNPPLIVARRLRHENIETQRKASVTIVRQLCLCQNGQTDTHLRISFSCRCQSCITPTVDVPCCERKGPATLRRGGHR